MKSSNILLDQNYTAKVSDFGAFRVMPMDKDYGLGLALKKKKSVRAGKEVNEGTLGYLDAEYFHNSEGSGW